MKSTLFKALCLIILSIFPIFTNADFVANRSLSTNEISREEITHIFLFIKKFDTRQGARLTVILPPRGSYLMRVLATHELQMSATQYLASVDARISDGTAAPIFAETEAEVISKLSINV